MKNFLFTLTVVLISLISNSQPFIQGSLQKNADPTKIDVVFKANYTSAPGEYINYLQFSLAIPIGVSSGVTATTLGVNTFSNMGSLAPIAPYDAGSERIFGWVFAYPVASKQSWDPGKEFTGVVVTFNKSVAAAKVKLLNLTKINGGINLNTYFAMVSSTGDVANYDNLFFEIKGSNHMGYNETTGDQFVQTSGLRKE